MVYGGVSVNDSSTGHARMLVFMLYFEAKVSPLRRLCPTRLPQGKQPDELCFLFIEQYCSI